MKEKESIERPSTFALKRICAVKIDRKGQNSKELTVHRGELIEIEDYSKKWWRARNFRGDIGHVPNNIVEEIEIEHRALVRRNTDVLTLKYLSILENLAIASISWKLAPFSNKHE